MFFVYLETLIDRNEKCMASLVTEDVLLARAHDSFAEQSAFINYLNLMRAAAIYLQAFEIENEKTCQILISSSISINFIIGEV